MKGQNVDELQKLVTAATQWRAAGASLQPTPVDVTQINAVIDGSFVSLAWDTSFNDWIISTS